MLRKTLVLTLSGLLLGIGSGAHAGEAYAEGRFDPLKVEVKTDLPELKPLPEVKVPSFEEGLQMLNESFQQNLGQMKLSFGDNSLVFGNTDKTVSSDVMNSLIKELPQLKPLETPKLPDVNGLFDAKKKQDAEAFTSFKNSLKPLTLPHFPRLVSPKSGSPEEQVAKWILDNVTDTLPSTGHVNLDSKKPNGWDQTYESGTKAYTPSNAFQNMKKPDRYGEKVGGQIMQMLDELNPFGGKPQVDPSKMKTDLVDKVPPVIEQVDPNTIPKDPVSTLKNLFQDAKK